MSETTPTTQEKIEERIEVKKIREIFPDALISVDTFRGDTRILVKREFIVDICKMMRETQFRPCVRRRSRRLSILHLPAKC